MNINYSYFVLQPDVPTQIANNLHTNNEITCICIHMWWKIFSTW